MLQRIQTIWLLLASACAGLTMKFSFFSGNKPLATGQPATFQSLTATSNILINIITVTLLVGSLINIFNYKNRRLQFRATIALIILGLANIAMYHYETKEFKEGNFDLTAALAIAIPVLLFLAARGIRKDQKLVKSLDRLR
jgi:peptidoglycan/LPS O-acetylase OafA/YrhL